MTFFQRVKEHALPSGPEVHLPGFSPPYERGLLSFFREVSLGEILASGSVWLFRGDFVMDYPRRSCPTWCSWGHQLCQQETGIISGVYCLTFCSISAPRGAHYIFYKNNSSGCFVMYWSFWWFPPLILLLRLWWDTLLKCLQECSKGFQWSLR